MKCMLPEKLLDIENTHWDWAHEPVKQKLLYCRQFILGPTFIEIMPGWHHIDIGRDLKLSIHPEVGVEQIACADKKLTVIGDIYDSLDPKKSNRDIISGLINRTNDIEALTKTIGQYGGRWILVASFGDNNFLLNDALGLRQVFYTEPNITGALWMVSQPGLAQRWLNLGADKDAEKFLDSYSVRIQNEFKWPASATAFRGLTHLLPNCYLDLTTGASHRFWPYESIGSISTKDAAVLIERRMTNLIRAAAVRYPLTIGITAGIDSRVLMALSKDICGEIDFVTVRQRNMPDNHPDIIIPDLLCKKYDLKRLVIKARPSMSADFSKLFKDSVCMATDIYGPDAEAIINSLHRKKAAITGSAGEIGQCFFRNQVSNNRYNGPIEAAELALLQHFPNEPFAIKHFQEWLDRANNRHNVNLMDLFYWEHSHGNWLAMTQLQFDIAWREIFTPYNCRDVLQTFLSVAEDDRKGPHFLLYKNLIARTWPELLDQPINPHKVVKGSAKSKIKKIIKRLVK